MLELQSRIAYSFHDRKLLVLALTHCSYSPRNNERLEFLGDAVLNLAIAQVLYEKLSDLPEGDLSRGRANLVKQSALYKIAMDIGLPQVIRLGESEQSSGGTARPSIMADTVEAIIGAVFLDGGYAAAEMLVRRLYEGIEIHSSMPAIKKDPKTELQEWLQARHLQLPIYRVASIIGSGHRQEFDIECEILERKLVVKGIGRSRREGEQSAAVAALAALRRRGPD